MTRLPALALTSLSPGRPAEHAERALSWPHLPAPKATGGHNARTAVLTRGDGVPAPGASSCCPDPGAHSTSPPLPPRGSRPCPWGSVTGPAVTPGPRPPCSALAGSARSWLLGGPARRCVELSPLRVPSCQSASHLSSLLYSRGHPGVQRGEHRYAPHGRSSWVPPRRAPRILFPK